MEPGGDFAIASWTGGFPHRAVELAINFTLASTRQSIVWLKLNIIICKVGLLHSAVEIETFSVTAFISQPPLSFNIPTVARKLLRKLEWRR